MESRDLVSVSRRVSRPVFWSLGLEGLVSVSKVSSRSRRSRLGLEGLVSVSKDFGLGLELFVSRLCIGYFLWSFARRSSFKKWFYKMIVQNLAVQRGQWLSFLYCYVVCELEKTICPLPRLKFTMNSIKNVHAPMKPCAWSLQREAESTLLRTIFELFSQDFCYETHRLIQKRWESAIKFLFWEAK